MGNMRISVRLDRETRQRLNDATQVSGKSESEVVRDALREYLDKQPPVESCLDLARRHRLIGRAKGLPRDLSTNAKHFEGFGR